MKIRWLCALGLMTLPLAVEPAAHAQPKPKPAASPSSTPSSAPAASASAAPALKPVDPNAALPPGHPGTGGDEEPPAGLPAGHPSVASDEEDGPQDNGALPDSRRVPRDATTDDPSLPPGTIVVTIKDADEHPMAHVPVVLTTLRSTVTKGDSSDRRSVDTDAAGVARFDDLSHAGGTTFRVSSTRGVASFSLPAFALGEKTGKRNVLHTYEASPILDSKMLVFMRAIVAVSLLEDSLKVEQLISVTNLGRVAWLADLPFALPKGFKAFDKQDNGDEDGRVEPVTDGAALRGTFAPGQHEMVFQYQVPLSGEAAQAIHLRLPDRVSEARVIAESSKAMGLDVRGFPPAQRVTARDGKHLLLTERQARAPGEASVFDITVSGLPTPGPGKTIALVLAVLALLGGIVYASSSALSGGVDPDAHHDLAEAREALLAELVALERARKSEDIGPKTYERLRASLLDALARVVGMIEKNAAAQAASSGSKQARSRAKTARREETT